MTQPTRFGLIKGHFAWAVSKDTPQQKSIVLFDTDNREPDENGNLTPDHRDVILYMDDAAIEQFKSFMSAAFL